MRGKKEKFSFIFSAIFLLGSIFLPILADPVEDKEALLEFAAKIRYSHSLNWSKNSSICSAWVGVTCNTNHSRVIALRLPGMAIMGPVPANTISRLSALQVLSLRSNSISGSFPSDFSNLRNLTSLYLQVNNFDGPLLEDFSVWKYLSVMDLSNNYFNGSIPSSISNLSHLTALNLANNSFSGNIPDINIPSLKELNLSNNNLTGTVPNSLQRFSSSSFAGNNLSSDENVLAPALPVQPPDSQPLRKRRAPKLSVHALLGIIIGACVLFFAVITLLLILCNSKNTRGKNRAGEKSEKSLKKRVSESQEKNNSKLVFFEGCNLAFDLEDLLRASAEVLGKGMFGTTYKAALEDATTVVVKRLKEVNSGKREFEQQMEVVGNIRHENVAPLRAYYYSKEEKLMVYDYYDHGSIAALIHGKRGEGRVPLDWDTRLRIAIGIAKGIAYVHTLNGGKLVHGDIKASNIFLNSQGHACVSDIGLATLMNSMPPPLMRTPGYRAPEITDTRKTTQPSDVYSFGVLILELLTGKSPIHTGGGEEVIHLVRWVNSVVREEWTAEVFDVELLRYPNIEEEMVEMLQIGMACVVRMPEQRPKMVEVAKMLEEIRRPGTGNQSEISSIAQTPPGNEIGSSSGAH